MSDIDVATFETPSRTRMEAVGQRTVEAVCLVIEACLGSLLGISTAAVFGTIALVAMTDLSLGTAVTAVALGINAMLFSLLVLGSLRR